MVAVIPRLEIGCPFGLFDLCRGCKLRACKILLKIKIVYKRCRGRHGQRRARAPHAAMQQCSMARPTGRRTGGPGRPTGTRPGGPGRPTGTRPGRPADRRTGQADRPTGRQADRPTGRQADRPTGRQADRHQSIVWMATIGHFYTRQKSAPAQRYTATAILLYGLLNNT